MSPRKQIHSASGDKDGGSRFLMKLYRILAAGDTPIRWDDTGRHILVPDANGPLVESAVKLAFGWAGMKGGGLALLASSLTGYGYRKGYNLESNSTAWSHPLLHRDCPVEQLRTISVASARAAAASKETTIDTFVAQFSTTPPAPLLRTCDTAQNVSPPANSVGGPGHALPAVARDEPGPARTRALDYQLPTQLNFRRGPGRQSEFVIKLYALLSKTDEVTRNAIRWDDSGTVILILDTRRVAEALGFTDGASGWLNVQHCFYGYGFKRGKSATSVRGRTIDTWTHSQLHRDYPRNQLGFLRRRDLKVSNTALPFGAVPRKAGKFLPKFFRLVSSGAAEISWDATGQRILVLDPLGLERLLEKEWGSVGGLPSLKQSLYAFGFKQTTVLEGMPEVGHPSKLLTWSHPVLTRDTPLNELLEVRRRAVSPRKRGLSLGDTMIIADETMEEDQDEDLAQSERDLEGKRVSAVVEDLEDAREFEPKSRSGTLESDTGFAGEHNPRLEGALDDPFLTRLFHAAEDRANENVLRWDETGAIVMLLDISRAASLLGTSYTQELKARGFVICSARCGGKLVVGWRHPELRRGSFVAVAN